MTLFLRRRYDWCDPEGDPLELHSLAFIFEGILLSVPAPALDAPERCILLPSWIVPDVSTLRRTQAVRSSFETLTSIPIAAYGAFLPIIDA